MEKRYGSYRALILEVWLPQALTIGVPYGAFWGLSPKTLAPFITSFQEKQKLKRNTLNFSAWLGGLYICSAIAACFSKSARYMDRPIDLEGEEEEKPVQAAATQFSAYAVMFNQKFNDGT